jgi:glycine oxidase
MTPDVIVVGAGAIGSSIAYHLAKAGARVVILDRGRAGGQASGASAGVLAPLAESSGPGPFMDLAVESLRLFQPLSDELRERTGMDIGHRFCGLVRVALTDTEERELRHRRIWQEASGIRVAWLDPQRTAELEPLVTPDLRGSLFYEQEQQVSPLPLVQALVRAAADLGVTVREGAGAESLLIEGDRVVGVGLGSERIRAPEVVLANGAWAASWSETLRTPLPVRPVRGQMVALRTVASSVRHIVWSRDGYLVCKAEGLTYVGATEEEVGFDARPTVEGVSGLLALVPRLVPGLKDAAFSHAWAGLRPGTPDRLPLLGRIPGWRGVSIAAGHFRNGILLAPITGVLISDLLRDGRLRMELNPFDPGRFLVRAA